MVVERVVCAVGSENGGILSLPEDGGATEVVVERVVCVVGSENGGILSLPDWGDDIKGRAGRWRTMGVALNRFLGTFIVLENVENRIKTLFWDSHRSGEESTRAAWRRSWLIGSENGGILSLPDLGDDIKGRAGRWRTMGVALNRFLGPFIVLKNVENRIKTLFWDSHRSGEESTRAAWRRSGLIGRGNGGILSLPDFGDGIEGRAGRWRTMGVALNRFLGTFIVLENVENRIKTLF